MEEKVENPSVIPRLGDLLITKGLITKEQLELAMEEQNKTFKALGEILRQLGYVSEDAIASVLACQAGAEIVNLDTHILEPDALTLIPSSFAYTHSVIPLLKNNGCLTVAVTDPFEIITIEEIERLTNLRVNIKVATKSDILRAIEQSYNVEKESLKDYDYNTVEESPVIEDNRVKLGKQKESKNINVITPAIRQIDDMILRAIKEGATDIHLKPKESEIQCRFRVDGVLHNEPSFPKELQSAITTRIKIMANLDISENRLPQNGKMVMLFEGRKMDLRVSTMSGIFGENIVLRILDRNKLLIGLDNLGFSPSNLRVFTNIILKSYGIVLVTGPTGSGKTTTLYSALSHVNSTEKNIMTLEDPVEYEVPEIFQSQVNLKAGLDFATGLKALLRQDPDIILVGEMRDAETVEAAIRAAITGHLVFSTLHTNDATGAIVRLYDMGVEANLLASALLAVVAQRLVRVICHHCKEKISPEKDLLDLLKLDSNYKNMDFYKGKGCEYCFGTGYKGRIGISEILSIDSSINSLITQRVDNQTLKKRALENGMTTMLEDGLQKVSDGITTIDEIKRVAYV